jgi:hypothetical protein
MINPNQEPQVPPLAQVEGAYLELKAHNREHTGLGNAMAGFLLFALEDSDIIEPDGSVTPANTTKPHRHAELTAHDKGEMSEDLLSLTADPVFKAVGLTRISSGGNWAAVGSRPTHKETQALAIVHPTKFTDLLDRSVGQIDKNPALASLYESTYASTINYLALSVTSNEELSEAEREQFRDLQLDILQKIYPSVSKLVSTDGIKANLELGTMYLNWGGKPEFADFIKAREAGLREKKTFSAAEWHQDSSPDSYTAQWTKLLTIYDNVSKKWGSSGDLALLMNGQIEDALDEASIWLDAGGYGDTDGYTANISPAIHKAIQEAAKRGIGS